MLRLQHYTLFMLAILFFWPLSCFANKDVRLVKKISRRFEKIHDIDYELSLRRISNTDATSKFYREVNKIAHYFDSVSDTATIKIPLKEFLEQWSHIERISASIQESDQKFMADVTSFYLRGLVRRRGSSKTLFPVYKA